ncbi:hypothetical protein [Kordiimonas sp.]|uniref:hypothetical protein n=1 Tax=Kordiimonas sp. TaxID=1970157 RepID=UPI003B518D8D
MIRSRYDLNRHFFNMKRRRACVTVQQCAAAAGVSTSTWYRRCRAAALGDDTARSQVIASIEAAYTPPCITPLARAIETGRCF